MPVAPELPMLQWAITLGRKRESARDFSGRGRIEAVTDLVADLRAGSRPGGGGDMSTGVKALRVLKFGSSVLVRPELYRRAAEEVRAEVASGCRVVAVVSAMGETTDGLLAAARAVTDAPDDALLAALLGTGEEASVALLAVALDATGVSVSAFTRTTVPVRTRGPLQDADPVDVDTDRILSVLESVEVVVFPGFVGVDAAGTPSLLGRGGSDLTALFLGHALGAAEIRLVKDVDGISPGDPRRKPEAGPSRT